MSGPTGKEDIFYYHLGIGYELFCYKEPALRSYELAFDFPITTAARRTISED